MEWLGLGKPQLYVLLQVGVAMALGSLIGYERERADKPAGLRTHMLVAGSAALFVGLGNMLLQEFATSIPGRMQSDPIRLLEAIITGVSFLGAGTIIFHREAERVEEITTAASLLMTSAIGATIGVKQWALGVALTLLVYVILHLFGRFKPNHNGEQNAANSRVKSKSEDPGA
jgi:putative Mg2+ transporter-C (MgtC) family protein